MREVTISGETVTITASPLTVYYYSREFNADLVEDFFREWARCNSETKNFNFSRMFQIFWAMAKSGQPVGSAFPDFETWLSRIDVPIVKPEIWQDVFGEGLDGFFRGSEATAAEQVIKR